jgi:hypothetical protein
MNRGRFRGTGRAVTLDKNSPSSTNLLVGKSIRKGREGNISKGGSTKYKPTKSVAKNPIIFPAYATVEAEVASGFNHQPGSKRRVQSNPGTSISTHTLKLHPIWGQKHGKGEHKVHTNDGGEVHGTGDVIIGFLIVDPNSNV